MCVMFVLSLFFFFKQKTAYEMRISDWSSDVCSSDLAASALRPMVLIVVVAATVRVEDEEHQAAAERQRDKAAEGHGDEPVDADVDLAEAPPEIDPRHQGGDEQRGKHGDQDDVAQGEHRTVPRGLDRAPAGPEAQTVWGRARTGEPKSERT